MYVCRYYNKFIPKTIVEYDSKDLLDFIKQLT